MKKLVFATLMLFCLFHASAQDQKEMDVTVFPDPVFVAPQPPIVIKGWTFIENSPSVTDNGTAGAVLVGEYPGKIVKFQFSGNAVGIAVAEPSEGAIEYSVDEADWERLDLKSERTSENKLWYFTLESGLKNRKHTLQIRMAPGNNSGKSKCILHSLYFNKPD